MEGTRRSDGTPAGAQRTFNNRYRVDGTLGTGGMANVYVGTDTLLRRRVAIKVLREQYADDDDFVKRFSYEAQSAAKLSHPNIVNVYDFGREDHSYYIVMELVDGSTLGEIMREERVLPEPVAVDYAIQIASGLAYAHRQGLLHRDVKPANILVTKDDVIKLSDFGIARAVSEHTLGVTQPGMVMGSVAYISPEQAQGHDIDERSDLYSVGVVLYQMLTGSLPFSGDTPVAVALKHVSEEPPPIDPATNGVSPAIASIVARLLRKQPAERFSSATELASALREARERPLVTHADGYGEAAASRSARVPPVAPPPRRSTAPDRREPFTVDSVQHDEQTGVDRRWLLLPILLVAAIAVGYFALRGPLFPTAKTIEMPNVTGLSAVQAQQLLTGLGVSASAIKTTNEDSTTVTRDHVIRQDPAPKTMLAANDPVTLIVSGGLPRVQVPDVKGYTVGDAQHRLQEVHLRSTIVNAYSATIPKDTVIDLSPGVNTSVQQNSIVKLTVSLGPRQVLIPSVVSMTVDHARSVLRKLGLELEVVQRHENDAPANTILTQEPEANSSAEPKARVRVEISTGPAALTVPDVTNREPDAAQSALSDAGLKVVRAFIVEAANPTGKVVAQDPPGGTKAKKGVTVTIRISVPGTIPDVTGMSVDEAKRALINAGYLPGNEAPTSDSSLSDGQVVRTEPEANSATKPGETVNLYVMRSGQ